MEPPANGPGAILSCDEAPHGTAEAREAPQQTHASPLPGATPSLPPQSRSPPLSIPKSPSPFLDVINVPAVPLLAPDRTVQTAARPPLPVVPSGTLEILSHSLCEARRRPVLSLRGAPDSPGVPHRTQNAAPRLPEDRTLAFPSPPSTTHSLSQNAPGIPPACAPPLAASPPPSPSHPEPFLLNSVTFTSSVCAASSSGPRPLPAMASAAPRHITPPQALSPPPPELTPPPAQQLGSDDEEQEDPTDYCKGEEQQQIRAGVGAGVTLHDRKLLQPAALLPFVLQVVTTR